MNRNGLQWLLLLNLVVSAACLNQTDAPEPPETTESNYRAARDTLLRARQHFGVPGEGLPSLVLEGSGRLNLSAQFQGQTPGGDTWVEYRESSAYNDDNRWLGYSQHYERPDGSRESLRFVYLPPDEMRLVHLVDRFAIHVSSPEFAQTRGRLARMMPPLLLEEALARPSGLRYLGQRSGEGGPLDAVIMPLDGQSLTLLFDRQAGHLRGLEYLADVPLLGDTVVAWEFFEPLSGQGLPYPSGYRIQFGGRTLQEVHYDKVTTSEVDRADVFQIPDEIPTPQPPPPRTAGPPPSPRRPVAREVDAGVYIVPELRGGFHVMFVDLGEDVAAFEAPTGWLELHQVPASDFVPGASSGSVSRLYIDLIRETLGDKPIRYLALSHHHGDHAGGLREFLAEGSTIVTAAQMTSLVERAVERPHTLDPDSRAGQSTPARIEVFSGARTLGEGPNRIELIEYEENDHAQGLTIMYLPERSILYVADLVYAWPEGRRPHASHLPSTRRFAQWLRARDLRPERIYTSHGTASPLSWERLQQVLEADGD
ncbi:MAG TPA: MBL fold metallo-hydrolase [Acidobacteriota bacterium]|nr:MBL fold metallo-hydrolase [Acidobacteriota bacterium]